jgi:hypothetical protein
LVRPRVAVASGGDWYPITSPSHLYTWRQLTNKTVTKSKSRKSDDDKATHLNNAHARHGDMGMISWPYIYIGVNPARKGNSEIL